VNIFNLRTQFFSKEFSQLTGILGPDLPLKSQKMQLAPPYLFS